MAQEGLITEAQATLLHNSVRTAAGGKTERRRAVGPTVAVVIVALIVVVAGAIWMLTNGGEPGAVQDVAKTLNQPGGHGEMNRSISWLLGFALLLVVPLLIWVWLHNSLVAKEEQVFNAWAQVESNFQRRNDLVPTLVELVSRYLKHERQTLSDVTGTRAEAVNKMAAAIDGLIKAQGATSEVLRGGRRGLVENDETLQELVRSQLRLKNNFSQIIAIAENYPELKSSDQFLELQAQLEGTENRINVARMRFNDAVGAFNGTMRMLPWSIVASAGHFKRKAYFRSDEEARNAPGLNLD